MLNITGNLTTKSTLSGEINTGSSLSGDVTIPVNVGVSDYNKLKNIPSIESVELRGNKTFDELGMQECSNQDILDMFK